MSYNDHGPAFKSDGIELDYGPPPNFSIHSHDAMIGQLAYKMKCEAQTATIAVNRLEDLLRGGFGADASAKAGAELTATMEACSDALANLIAYLTRNEPKPPTDDGAARSELTKEAA